MMTRNRIRLDGRVSQYGIDETDDQTGILHLSSLLYHHLRVLTPRERRKKREGDDVDIRSEGQETVVVGIQ